MPCSFVSHRILISISVSLQFLQFWNEWAPNTNSHGFIIISFIIISSCKNGISTFFTSMLAYFRISFMVLVLNDIYVLCSDILYFVLWVIFTKQANSELGNKINKNSITNFIINFICLLPITVTARVYSNPLISRAVPLFISTYVWTRQLYLLWNILLRFVN